MLSAPRTMPSYTLTEATIDTLYPNPYRNVPNQIDYSNYRTRCSVGLTVTKRIIKKHVPLTRGEGHALLPLGCFLHDSERGLIEVLFRRRSPRLFTGLALRGF